MRGMRPRAPKPEIKITISYYVDQYSKSPKDDVNITARTVGINTVIGDSAETRLVHFCFKYLNKLTLKPTTRYR